MVRLGGTFICWGAQQLKDSMVFFPLKRLMYPGFQQPATFGKRLPIFDFPLFPGFYVAHLAPPLVFSVNG
jgi:hypothetical protein